jgi:hypothetical protein
MLFALLRWRMKKLDAKEVFERCCEVEDLYVELCQIKEKVADMFDKTFRSRVAQEEESVWMGKIFLKVKNKRRFMVDGEEILDVNEIDLNLIDYFVIFLHSSNIWNKNILVNIILQMRAVLNAPLHQYINLTL